VLRLWGLIGIKTVIGNSFWQYAHLAKTQRMRYTMAMLTNYLRVAGAKPKQIYKYTAKLTYSKRKREVDYK